MRTLASFQIGDVSARRRNVEFLERWQPALSTLCGRTTITVKVRPRFLDQVTDTRMDDFVAYPSRWRIALLTLGSLIFVVIGLWMGGAFGSPPTSSRYSPGLLIVVGWSAVIFFGLCGVLWFKRMFDGREQLRIGSAGVRSMQWSNQTIPWSEIVDVTTWSFKRQKAIVLHLRDKARFPAHGVAAMFAGLNRNLTGGDISISLTGTNRTVEDALSAIQHFRSRAAQGSPS
jgi:hypothetical protein